MRKHNETLVNPIYHWNESDIWDYIKQKNIVTNPLYECGYRRVGCIGCPLAQYKQRIKGFIDYPKYKTMYIAAFEKMNETRKEKGLAVKWQTGKEVFDWWIEEYKHNVKGQMDIWGKEA